MHAFPHSPQISADYDCYRDSAGLERNKIYSNKIFDLLKTFAAKSDIKLILSNDALAGSKMPPYFPCDMHLNQQGHDLIADLLFRDVKNILDINN